MMQWLKEWQHLAGWLLAAVALASLLWTQYRDRKGRRNQVEDTERDRALEDERNRVKVEAKVEEIERRLDRMERRLDAGEAPRNTGVRDT